MSYGIQNKNTKEMLNKIMQRLENIMTGSWEAYPHYDVF